jgi:guanylate kinase
MTNEEVIERRLREAKSELDRIWEYRYALVNDHLDVAVQELAAIVRSERGERDGVAEIAWSCVTSDPSEKLRKALQSFRTKGSGM